MTTATRRTAAPLLALAATLATSAFLSGAASASTSASTSAAASWSIQTTPDPHGTNFDTLSAVSCSSSTACTAAGTAASGVSSATLAERWNGTAWKIQKTPNPAGFLSVALYGVSCPSASACTAVGDDENSSGFLVPLAERWNGSAWKIQSIPSPSSTAGELALYGVSCPSATACTAVGSYEDSTGADKIFAEHWNGTTWSLQTTPAPAGAQGSFLYGVSCSAATACTAIGASFTAGPVYSTLAERWNGSAWTIQHTPNPAGATLSLLLGVSCPSATSCTAAGDDSSSSGTQKTLAERWNGTTWSLQSTPNPSGPLPVLNAVSCSSAGACTAAGNYEPSSGQKTLAERWNGTAWAIQSTPNPSGNGPTLNGVSCPAAAACTATGDYQTSSGVQKTLAERYGT